jgi:hypothetical protein
MEKIQAIKPGPKPTKRMEPTTREGGLIYPTSQNTLILNRINPSQKNDHPSH